MLSQKLSPHQRTHTFAQVLRRDVFPERLTLYALAVGVVVIAFIWQTVGLRPGIGLVSSLLPLGLLLLLWQKSIRSEKICLALFTVLALLLEVHTARLLKNSSRAFVVCRLVAPNVARVDLKGAGPIQAVMMYVIDADALARFLATHIDDGDAYARVVQGVPVGQARASPTRLFSLRPLQRSIEVSHYEVIFYASNGSWVEDLQTAMVKGHIANALRIRHVENFQQAVIYQDHDPDFPLAHPDWTWAVSVPGNFGFFGPID